LMADPVQNSPNISIVNGSKGARASSAGQAR
jgi:hypothetical protein